MTGKNAIPVCSAPRGALLLYRRRAGAPPNVIQGVRARPEYSANITPKALYMSDSQMFADKTGVFSQTLPVNHRGDGANHPAPPLFIGIVGNSLISKNFLF